MRNDSTGFTQAFSLFLFLVWNACELIARATSIG